MHIKFEPMDTATATHLRNGGLDSNGNPAEQKISDGNGVPCRVCMKMVGNCAPYLIAGWRPFSATHAYAETGPVFLHAEECSRRTGSIRHGCPNFLKARITSCADMMRTSALFTEQAAS
jgi:hypothetical protein